MDDEEDSVNSHSELERRNKLDDHQLPNHPIVAESVYMMTTRKNAVPLMRINVVIYPYEA